MTATRPVLIVLLLVVGAFLLVRGHLIAGEARALPRISVEAFAEGRAEGLHFAVLTGVSADYESSVLHRDMDAALTMYIPLRSKSFRPVILELLDNRERRQFKIHPERKELTVQTDRRIEDVDPGLREALARKNPGLRLDAARIATVGLHEPTYAKAQRVARYGLLAFWAAGMLLLRRRPAGSVTAGADN